MFTGFIPLALGSFLGYIPWIIFVFLFAYRITVEEKFLINELDGYTEYKEKVRKRLIPYIRVTQEVNNTNEFNLTEFEQLLDMAIPFQLADSNVPGMIISAATSEGVLLSKEIFSFPNWVS